MIQFEKYQGLGNDFIIPIGQIPPSLLPISIDNPLSQAQAKIWSKLCDRRYGIGADGVLLKVEDATGNVGMQIVNQDGSQAEMCGNGLRCMALHLSRQSLCGETKFDVHTLAGIMKTQLTEQGVQCHMGEADVKPLMSIIVDGKEIEGYFVSTGNPHFVIFEAFDYDDRHLFAERICTHPAFVNGVNVSFAAIESQDTIVLNVFERGCGWTKACGTAATATVAAYWVDQNRLNRATQVTLPGGPLQISGTLNDMIMIGEATFVFEGRYSLTLGH